MIANKQNEVTVKGKEIHAELWSDDHGLTREVAKKQKKFGDQH